MEVKFFWIFEIFLCILVDVIVGSNLLDFEEWKVNNDRLYVNFIHFIYFWVKN